MNNAQPDPSADNHGRLVDFIEMKERKAAPHDPRPHRTAFNNLTSMVWNLAGDVVLVPFKDGEPDWQNTSRETLTKISHWSDMEEADIPRLGILTDSFFRFIDEGQDASIVTLWREGTPVVAQIDGEPCEAALDLVQDAITGQSDLKEKWHGLPPLEAEIEKLAYRHGFVTGHRPNWLERKAQEILKEKGIEIEAEAPDEPSQPEEPEAANDNWKPTELTPKQLKRLQRIQREHGGEIRGNTLFGANFKGACGQVFFMEDGEPWFWMAGGARVRVIDRQPIEATPFSLRDPASLPERDWLFGLHYIRRYLTSTVGAGGGGKSAHAVSEVLAMVTGRPLLDPDGPLTKPLRVWYVNAEDPQDEIDRRFHAAAKHFNVTAEQLGDRLYTDSGRDQEFVIMRQVGRELFVCQPLIDDMVAEIERRQIDVVIIDPLVSTHEVQENDNGAMQRVAKAWTEVADRANCGVEVIHHIVKNAGEATADSARGGGALKDKTRGMRVINAMTKDEASKVGFKSPDGYFRIDHGKVNMVASGRSGWRRFVSVPLGNGGTFSLGDEIGVVEPWQWPSSDVMAERAAEARRAVVADVPDETLAGLKVRLANAEYKASPQGKPWAGDVVMELTGVTDKKIAKSMLDAWMDAGELEIVDIPDAYRKLKPHIKPVAAL